jgi:molybdopterin converting factor small subunit
MAAQSVRNYREVELEARRVIKIRIRFPRSVILAGESQKGGWQDIEREAVEGTTVIQLLSDLVSTYPGFREGVFNPQTGTLNEQIGVVVNDQLLTFSEVTQNLLADDDRIVIVPIYAGG